LCYNIHWKVQFEGMAMTMRRIIAPADMLRCEQAYFESSGVPSIEVMERAAAALRDAVLARHPGINKVYIACGPGGNGGDGYACARLLKDSGIEVRILEIGEAKSPDAIENRRRAAEKGIPFGDDGAEPELWLDCLFGTGLSRAPGGRAAETIERMNRSPAPVIACDIPSGLNGRTGEGYEPCICAEATVSFQYAKYGQLLQDGLDMCGELIIADVGFPASAFPDALPELFEPADIRPLTPPRKRNCHKGSCGHLLIVAGSVGMAGAAALCARAALRSGVGLVTVACPAEIVPILQIHAPCALCLPLPQVEGCIAPDATEILKAALQGKSAVAVGCGLTREVDPEILRILLSSGLKTVVDADALNIIAENPALRAMLRSHHVLTPHPGEAARLLGRRCSDPMADTQALAETGAVAVLKGASRVICSGRHTWISATGSCAMARGGSGDVLTGIIGALLAEPCHRTAAESALIGCELHGLCGLAAAEKYGIRGANSADLIEMLPEVLKNYAE